MCSSLVNNDVIGYTFQRIRVSDFGGDFEKMFAKFSL